LRSCWIVVLWIVLSPLMAPVRMIVHGTNLNSIALPAGIDVMHVVANSRFVCRKDVANI